MPNILAPANEYYTVQRINHLFISFMYTKKRILLFSALIVTVAGLLIGGIWGMQKNNPITITIGYRTHDLYAPLFVGVEQKIFERAGITLNPVKFESTNQLTDALLGKKIDAALGGVNIPLVLTIEEKSPGALKIFSVALETNESPASALLVKNNSTIASINDLRGKKIGANPGSTMQFIYRKMIERHFNPSEATLVQMKPELELPALESGQIDAAIVLEPYATIAVQKGIARILVPALFNTYVLTDMPLAASVMSTDFLKTKPNEAKRLVEATQEAITFTYTHPDKTKVVLAQYLALDRSVIQKLHTPTFIGNAEIDWKKIQALSDVLTRAGELKTTLDVRALALPQ